MSSEEIQKIRILVEGTPDQVFFQRLVNNPLVLCRVREQGTVGRLAPDARATRMCTTASVGYGRVTTPASEQSKLGHGHVIRVRNKSKFRSRRRYYGTDACSIGTGFRVKSGRREARVLVKETAQVMLGDSIHGGNQGEGRSDSGGSDFRERSQCGSTLVRVAGSHVLAPQHSRARNSPLSSAIIASKLAWNAPRFGIAATTKSSRNAPSTFPANHSAST